MCLVGALLALVISHVLRGPQWALYGVLAGMAVRVGIPSAFALAIIFYGGPLAEGGILYYLLVFYPVTLGVETILSLPQPDSLRQTQRSGHGPNVSNVVF